MKHALATGLVALLALDVAACSAAHGNDTNAGPQANAYEPTAVADAGPGALPVKDAGVAPVAPMGSPRSLFGTVSGADGRVRVFGGLVDHGLADSVESYDATTNTWTEGKPGTVHRYAHAVAQDSAGNAYVMGGSLDGPTPLATVQMYSPSTDTWTALPRLPTPRLGLAAAASKDGRIFAIGGGVPGKPTDVVEVYAPDTQTWTTGPKMPTARLSLQAVTGADGLIYAIGGRDAATTPLAIVEVLDPVAGTWKAAAPMKTPRYWFGAALAHDGRVFVLGGIGVDGFEETVEAMTPDGRWTTLASLPEPRAWLGAGVTSDGRWLAIGGATESASPQPPPVASIFSYDPIANAWAR